MQFQSDILDKTVRRPVIRETTALGAAYLAGLTVGLWKNRDELRSAWQCDVEFRPEMTAERRETLTGGWHRAIRHTLSAAD